ncbi:MAG: hypothetical protein ACM3SY_06015 [Candidatus Omnitrophota bacterium]
MIEGKAKLVLDSFKEAKIKYEDAHIEEIILLSYKGLTIVSTEEDRDVNDIVSAMASGTNSLIARFLKDKLEWKPFESIWITGSNKNLLIKNIEDIGLLVIISGVQKRVNPLKHIEIAAKWLVYMFDDLKKTETH